MKIVDLVSKVALVVIGILLTLLALKLGLIPASQSEPKIVVVKETVVVTPTPLIPNLMVVETDTLATAEALESVQERGSVHHPQKVERFAALLAERLDWGAVQRAAELG